MPTAYSHLAGAEVDTASEQWRLECECRWLLAEKPTRTLKHTYLYGVVDRDTLFPFDARTGRKSPDPDTTRWIIKAPLMKHRGLAGADRLLAEAKRLHELTSK